jgi:hypothetical protein
VLARCYACARSRASENFDGEVHSSLHFALRCIAVACRIFRPGSSVSVVWAVLFFVSTPLLLAARAEPLTSIPNPRVQNGTWVTDMSGTLRADTIARLNERIGEFERATGAEMAVVVIRSLDGSSIEEAAAKLFELWGIGKKGQDNGLLLLWSTGDRRVRVEVSYGSRASCRTGRWAPFSTPT